MLTASGIFLGFESRSILSDISVQVGPSDRVAVIGPSGSGKTTLLRALIGLLEPRSGRVTLDDKEIWNVRGQVEQNRALAPDIWPYVTMLFQELNLFPNLSARENCLIGIASDDVRRAEQELLQLAARLQVEDCLMRKPRQLSHGQRQRIAIIRGAVRRPGYFFLDEPTSDPDSRKRLAELLSDRQFFEGTAITATHDLHFAHEVANRFWSISDDRLIVNDSFSEAISIYGE